MSNEVHITTEPGTPFIDIVREFDAPVERVYAAHSDPELYAQWVGPRGYETDVVEHDMRTGGSYRFVQRDPAHPERGEFAFHGVFHSVRENEYSVQTFEFEGWPDVVSLDTYRFQSLPDGRSRLSTHSIFPSVEARDGMVDSGMSTGVVEGYERIDELLEREA
ncbi:SRPBCC family protein [Microbacterium pygmaeum]|uniref:Uncharacterized conserved protein YndB, AHSA1/START domain n=1 Tax=Microbacterium pygmaeum TaxID=370764 RepID=A0A1G8DDB9_9MICO|nr:SRPBCC family protein [Microbacterium pygmaeum]SDH55675.1 Uncharacterized conserved protein YndB, AHSA1/START domain [Microbacterium pygmaeum]